MVLRVELLLWDKKLISTLGKTRQPYCFSGGGPCSLEGASEIDFKSKCEMLH